MKSSLIPVFIPHLGCPNDCVFCNQRRIAAPRAPAADEVRELVTAGLKYARMPQIAFYGGSFTAIPAELQEEYLACACEFVRRGEADSVRVSTRPDCVDGETLSRLAAYGVRTVELGAQSMDDGVLAAAKRGHGAEDTRRAARLVKAAGMELVLQMMVGLPRSDREAELATARELAALKPVGVRIYPVCVIEDTELCDMYRGGEYEPLSVERAADICADVLEIFEAEGIPVIRIGLNPTEELSAGGAVAGAYHPAMGELVRSRLYLKRALRLLGETDGAGEAVISVQRGRAPLMRGQKSMNLRALAERFPQMKISIIEAAGQNEPVRVRRIYESGSDKSKPGGADR